MRDLLPTNFWLRPLLHADGWLILGANALPLLGALWLGWDASTLIILYWFETAIIGLWALVRLLAAPTDAISRVKGLAGGKNDSINGPGLALFVLAHAGIFMAVHLFFLEGLLPGEWRRHLGSPAQFFFGFVIPSGIWLPLAGLFVVRGIIAISDIRIGAPLTHVISGFYARILLMQFTILFGGFLALAVGGVAMLTLLIVLKTVIDLYTDTIIRHVHASMDEAAGNKPDKT